jgi:hypothetical protein
MQKACFTLSLWLGLLSSVLAQTQYRLAATAPGYSSTDDTLCLDLYLSFDVPGPLGSCNLVLSYDENSLTDPHLTTSLGVDPTYFYPALLTEFGSGRVSLNLEMRDSTGGMPIPGAGDSLHLGTVCFVVAQRRGDRGVSWYTAGTRGTVVYQGNEMNRLLAGDLLDFTPPPPEPGAGPALIGFVTGNASQPPAGDQSVADFLTALGHTVEWLDEDHSTTADAQGKDLLYISSTILSSRVGDRFREVQIPVIVGESHLMDDMQMSSGGYGNTNGLDEIEVQASSHPIMDGVGGNLIDVYTPNGRGVWGRPSSEATIVATWPGRSHRSLIYCYETGDQMVGLTAPARRMGFFFYEQGLINATEDAKTLLANSVCWALGCQNSGPSLVGDPYGGIPWPIPGMVQAEDFDEAGEGQAYHDQSHANHGGQYRSEGVDIQPTADQGGGYNVGWIREDEWLNYTIDVQQAGDYQFAFRVASRSAGGLFHLEVDGADVSGPITFAATGGWQNWTTVYAGPIALAEGPQVLRIHMDGRSFNLNHFEATLSQGNPAPQVQTITLSPIHDAYLQNGTRYNNTLLRVENASNRQRQSYLRFDLSQVQGEIWDAQLKLTCVSDPGHGPMTLHLGDDAVWTETNLTNSNRPQPVQALGSLSGSYDRNEQYSWPVGPIRDSVYLNLMLEHIQGNDAAFASKEYGNPNYRPQLVLQVMSGTSQQTTGVDWLNLEALPGTDDVQVNWWVSREKGINLYQLQRSIDGISFQNIGLAASQGDIHAPRMYSLVDADPLAQHKYYRIQATGESGYVSYSEVVNLDQSSAVLTFSVYPNPLEADQLLHIDLEVPQAGPVLLSVFNYQGAQIMSEPRSMTQTNETLEVDINALQPGLYIVSVMGQGWVKSERFQVQ